MIQCLDKESALYGLRVLRSLVKADVSELADTDRILFGNKGAEIRRVRNALQSQPTYAERLSAAQIQGPVQNASFCTLRDTTSTLRETPPASAHNERATITHSRTVRKVYLLHENYRVGWLLDRCASKCFACKSAFSLTSRRHHCRACGNIFCSKCSDHRIKVQGVGVRACILCHTRFKSRPVWALKDFLDAANAFEQSDNCTPLVAGVPSKLEGVQEVDEAGVAAEDSGVLGMVVSECFILTAESSEREQRSNGASEEYRRSDNYDATMVTVSMQDSLQSADADPEGGATPREHVSGSPPLVASGSGRPTMSHIDVGVGSSPEEVPGVSEIDSEEEDMPQRRGDVAEDEQVSIARIDLLTCMGNPFVLQQEIDLPLSPSPVYVDPTTRHRASIGYRENAAQGRRLSWIGVFGLAESGGAEGTRDEDTKARARRDTWAGQVSRKPQGV